MESAFALKIAKFYFDQNLRIQVYLAISVTGNLEGNLKSLCKYALLNSPLLKSNRRMRVSVQEFENL